MRTLLLLAALLLPASMPLGAQGRTPGNVNDMILEVMRTDLGKDRQSMAMWLPPEFFIAAGVAQTPGLDPKEMEKELAFLQDYAVFMVQAKAMGEDGATSLSTAQLRALATLVDEAGRTVKPLSELPPKVESLLNLVRQGFASQRGGEDYRLLVFPGREAGAQRTFASPTRRGAITLRLGKTEAFPGMALSWKTPLASFVSPVACAKCGEALQPAWSYCPWCAKPVPAK